MVRSVTASFDTTRLAGSNSLQLRESRPLIPLIPAQAGIQRGFWVPAFAGTSGLLHRLARHRSGPGFPARNWAAIAAH